MNDKLVPNSAQIPNILSDFVYPHLGEAEMRCLHYIARRTFGFHKDFDRISLSQFTDGLTNKGGKVLDAGTGLTKQSVVNGLSGLKEKGLIKVNVNQAGSTYEINLEASLEWINSLRSRLPIEQSKDQTTSSLENRPGIVKGIDTQKKGKKGGEKSKNPRGELGEAAVSTPKIEPGALVKVVEAYYSVKGWSYSGSASDQKLFRRYLRPAKQLYELCDNSVEECAEVIRKVGEWAKSRDLDWSIETIFKKWYDIDLLKPKEKKPYFEGKRIFQKVADGKWWCVSRDGEIRELGLWPRPEQIVYR